MAFRWIKNLNGASEPLYVPGAFQAGATQAIVSGQALELTGATNTRWVPIDSDFSMAANIAIACCDIKSGDLEGFYPMIVPRPGDVFEVDLAASGNSALGTAVYYSSATAVTVTAGTNILGHIAGWDHYPFPQNFASDDAGPDMGTTLSNHSKARITIEQSNSYYVALQAD